MSAGPAKANGEGSGGIVSQEKMVQGFPREGEENAAGSWKEELWVPNAKGPL